MPTRLETKLVELFIDSIVTNGLSTIVLRVKENNYLIALQNIARRMILWLQSRKEMKANKLKKEIKMRHLELKYSKGGSTSGML